MTTSAASKPRLATDAFLPSGAVENYHSDLQQHQQNHLYNHNADLQYNQGGQLHHHRHQDWTFPSSFSSYSHNNHNRQPSPQHHHSHTNNNNHYNTNLASISSPPVHSGFPPSTLPLPNDSALLSPPSYSSPSNHQPLPLSKNHQQRFRSNLSPIKQNGPTAITSNSTYQAPPPPFPSSNHLPPPQRSDIPDVNNGAAFLYRSVSADATSTAANPSSHIVQRLAQQNAHIREAWEAERNYLEANRRRAEEVYQEERVIMEEVREAWENEKAVLLRENQMLKERIQRLEGENTTLRSLASQGGQPPGVMSPIASQRCDSTAASESGSGASGPSSSVPPPQQHQQKQPLPPAADPSSLPPGLDGAARRPHHIGLDRLSPGNSRLSSPTKQPESSPFIPLDPRTQPQDANPRDFLHADENDESIPAIDVQELDPQLDGIQLKATAVQKSTFGQSSQNSPSTSPPVADAPHVEERMGLQKRMSSKDHTFQVLRAEESRRLTMHAGHTPNHSLSLFPTMSVVGASTANTQDDDTAPSEGGPSPAPVETKDDAEVEQPKEEEQQQQQQQQPPPQMEEPEPPVHPEPVEPELDEPEEQLMPAEDRRLKGPLMIKNIPAQDEIFWDQVNKKLEPISQGQDALPTVMMVSSEEGAAAGPSGAHMLQAANAAVAPVGGDASHDPRSFHDPDGAEGDNAENPKPIEADVPLKLKTTTNFGAPFGMA